MDALATIVIPLKRQRDAWLEQCLLSAVEQSVACEVLVVRSESTPLSNVRIVEKLAAQRSNLRVLTEEKAGSFPGAINQGIRSASTSRVGLLLSDDWLEEDAVEVCLSRSADIVCTGLNAYLADGTTLHPGASQTLTVSHYESLSSLEARASYLQHFFVFRREALLRVGGLDEAIGNFPGIDDYDLIWTMLEQDATVDIVEQRLYNYRDHAGERLTLADADQAIRNLEKILTKHGVPAEESTRLLRDQSRWFGRPIHEVLAEDSRT